jgi:hypothetical protein
MRGGRANMKTCIEDRIVWPKYVTHILSGLSENNFTVVPNAVPTTPIIAVLRKSYKKREILFIDWCYGN